MLPDQPGLVLSRSQRLRRRRKKKDKDLTQRATEIRARVTERLRPGTKRENRLPLESRNLPVVRAKP